MGVALLPPDLTKLTGRVVNTIDREAHWDGFLQRVDVL